MRRWSRFSTDLFLISKQKLTFKPHNQEKIKKAKTRFNIIKKHLPATETTEKIWATLYKTTIRPILTYGQEATITSTQEAEHLLVTTERKILRYIYRAPRHTKILALYVMAARHGITPITNLIQANRRKALELIKNHVNPLLAAVAEISSEPYEEVKRLVDQSDPETPDDDESSPT